MKLDKALNSLLSGGKIKRSIWPDNEYLEASDVKNIGVNKGLIIMHVKPTEYSGIVKSQWQPLVEEISEEDWIVIKEEEKC